MVETVKPIRVSNRDVYQVRFDGDLTDVDARVVGIAHGTGRIVEVAAYAETAPTTDSADFDINVDGTTIFSGATKVSIAATEKAATVGAIGASAAEVSDGSVITVDVDALDTGDTADGITVQVVVE